MLKAAVRKNWPGAPPKVAEVVNFYATVVNTNRALYTRVCVDKPKDMEPAKTKPEAKAVCRLTR